VSHCDCDWEANGTWEDISSSWHRARKERRCDECGLTIRKGDRYHRTVGKWEGDLVTNAICALCTRINVAHWNGIHAARKAVRERGEYSSYEGYVIGELRCAVACMVKCEPAYLVAFRQSWHEQKAAA